MGPAVAASERRRDSRCFPHQQQQMCEEVGKISAAPRPVSPNPASVKISKPECTLCPIRHSDILQNCMQGWGVVFFGFVVVK